MEGLNDQELFNQAISNEPVTPEATPEPAAPAAPEPSPEPQLVRDEHGRFAPKTVEAEVQPAAPAEPPQGFVPSGRHREESEARRLAERERDEARAQLAILSRQQQPQPAPQPPKVPTDIFENPDEAIRERVAPQLQEFQSVMLSLARDNAELRYTPEKVNEAERAFIQALQSRTLDQADYHRVVSSPNRYAAAVQWHQQQSVLKEVGGDPAAYRTRILDEAMKDPAFQAKVIETARANASGQPPGKTGTVVQLPPSINRSASAASPHEVGGDLSNESLYAFATK